jgi:selenocysteine lyase/cysteine desulfurase
MPMDLHALGADFAVCAAYKWLMGPYGTGFVWARREHTERMAHAPFYWMSAVSGKNFHELTYDPDANGNYAWQAPAGGRRWDMAETASFFHLSAFAASLEFVLRAGPAAVRDHNRALLRGLLDRLPADRCVLASPREAEARGPFLCIAARNHQTTTELYGRLREQKIYVSLRNQALRVAPYLYNTDEDMERLIRAISV